MSRRSPGLLARPMMLGFFLCHLCDCCSRCRSVVAPGPSKHVLVSTRLVADAISLWCALRHSSRQAPERWATQALTGPEIARLQDSGPGPSPTSSCPTSVNRHPDFSRRTDREQQHPIHMALQALDSFRQRLCTYCTTAPGYTRDGCLHVRIDQECSRQERAVWPRSQ